MEDKKAETQFKKAWNKLHDDPPKEQETFYILKELDTDERVSALNEILEKVGVSISVSDIEHDSNKMKMEFKIDFEKYGKVTNRTAGGRKKDFKKTIKHNPSIREFKELQKKMKPNELIEYLGCSKSTYYRMLKLCDEKDELLRFFDL
jgi:hypothetical protein